MEGKKDSPLKKSIREKVSQDIEKGMRHVRKSGVRKLGFVERQEKEDLGEILLEDDSRIEQVEEDKVSTDN